MQYMHDEKFTIFVMFLITVSQSHILSSHCHFPSHPTHPVGFILISHISTWHAKQTYWGLAWGPCVMLHALIIWGTWKPLLMMRWLEGRSCLHAHLTSDIIFHGQGVINCSESNHYISRCLLCVYAQHGLVSTCTLKTLYKMNNMANILQTTFSKAFPPNKILYVN